MYELLNNSITGEEAALRERFQNVSNSIKENMLKLRSNDFLNISHS